MRGRRDVVKGKERKGRYERMERYGKRGERESGCEGKHMQEGKKKKGKQYKKEIN